MFKSYWFAVVLAGVTGLSVMTDAQSCAGSAELLFGVVETLASHQQLITSQVSDSISGVRKMIASECEKANETTLVNEIRDVKRRIESGCEEANETRLAEIEKVVKESKEEIEEIEEKISGVKNETNRVLDVLGNVVNAIKTIASNQQKNADELSQVKRLLESNQSRACECVNSACPSPAAPVVVVNSTDCVTRSTTVSPPESSSKQALVSALVCEYRRLLSVKHYSTDSTLVRARCTCRGLTAQSADRGSTLTGRSTTCRVAHHPVS